MSNYLWYSRYTGHNWDPKRHGYNEYWATQIQLLREWFGLRKLGGGREAGTEHWKLYQLPHAERTFICLERVDWAGSECRSGHTTPVIELRVRMARAHRHSNGRTQQRTGFWNAILGREEVEEGVEYTRGDEFLNDTLRMEFPRNYPDNPPLFQSRSTRGHPGAWCSHAHHLNDQGWMCLFAGRGDWGRRRGTFISALGIAFDWMAWHYNQWGW